MSARYTYLAADLLTGAIREEVPFSDVSFSHVLNGAGGFEGKLPLEVKNRAVPQRAYLALADVSSINSRIYTADHPDLDFSGQDAEVELEIRMPDWSPAAGARFLDRRFNAADGGIRVGMTTTGALNFTYSVPGPTAQTETMTVPIGGTDGAWERVKITLQGNNGAGSRVARFYRWVAGAWSLINTVTTAGTVASILPGIFDLNVGSDIFASMSWDFDVRRVILRDGINGPTMYDLDLRWKMAGQTAVTDAQGHGWTVAANAALVNDPDYPALPAVNRITRSVLDPARTRLHVLRDGSLVWSGILWAVQAAVESDTLTVAGQGVWSYFARRELEATLTFLASTDDQFQIVDALLDWAQAQPGGDLGLTATWSALSGVKRDRTYYAYERKNIAEAIEQLAEVEDGFDFAVDVGGSVAAGFTYALTLSYPHRGRRTNLVFETQKNVRVLQWGLDAWTMTNRQAALGAGEGDGMLVTTAADPAALTAYPLLNGSSAHKDVSVLATLAAHAQAELKAASGGTETLSVEVLPDEVDAALGSFITGDEVLVRGGKGYVDLDAYYRVTSYGVKVDSSGREVLQATLSNSEETI